MKYTAPLLTILAAFTAQTAHANDLSCGTSYGFRVDVAGSAGETMCTSSVRDLEKMLKNFRLSNPNYTDVSEAVGYGRINDLKLSARYNANRSDLIIDIPELGIENQTFTGENRNQSEDEFKSWLKKSGVVGDIMNYQAKHTPNSPITGASGIIPSMASTDFNQEINTVSNIATSFSSQNIDVPSDNNSGSNNQTNSTANNTTASNSNSQHFIGAGVNVSSYTIKGSDERVHAYTLPLSYSFNTGKNERSQFTLSLPVTMYSVGKAKGYHVGLGAGYRFPITEKWSLAPAVRYAVTGSADRATIAGVSSGTLTSTYHIPLKKFDLNIGNMVGYYRTNKFKAGEYSFNPNIRQTILRNGVMLSQPLTVKNHKLAIEYSLVDTRYVGGNRPFMRNMQEIGITLGTHRDHENKKLSFMRAGVGYMRAKDTKGFNVNFGYWF